MHQIRGFLYHTVATLLLAGPAQADQVRHVIDGDTLVLASGAHVRLWGLDAPELGEPGGAAARAELARFTAGRDVTCQRRGRSHERIVAQCWADGVDLAAAMVASGVAWGCPRFTPAYGPGRANGPGYCRR